MITLRASTGPRAFKCFGSVKMEQAAPEQPDSDDAKEGTAVHWVAEMVNTGQVGSALELVDRQAPNGIMITGVMAEHVQPYIDDIDLKRRCIKPYNGQLHIEQTLHQQFAGYSGNVIAVQGTPDAASHTATTIDIDDLKYGYRIVEVKENWQLLLYAIMYKYRHNLQPNVITMTIHQPRPYHRQGSKRVWQISGEQLYQYEIILAQAVDAIHDPSAGLRTGPWCHFCRAFNECEAAQQAGMNAVDVAMKATSDQLSPYALGRELQTLLRAKRMIEQRWDALEETAIHRIKQGQIVSDWGLEQAFGNRAWSIDPKIIELVTGVRMTEDKPITPAKAERALTEAGIEPDLYVNKTTAPKASRGFKLVQVDLDDKAKELFK